MMTQEQINVTLFDEVKKKLQDIKRKHEENELRMAHEIDQLRATSLAMREAIREAHAALDGCREDTCELFADHDWWKDEHRCDYSTRWAEMKSRITKADAALAKLQPFITP
jgi:molybdopterin synthase catalytic subunit